MQVLRIRNDTHLKRLKDSVVAIGSFDGVHAAHRKIIFAAVRYARRNCSRCVVLTFWPHPQKKESLYSLEHRLRIIEELGVDTCALVSFTRGFAALSPRDFVRDFLVARLGARAVFVGENFRFGKNAAGNAALLRAICAPLKIRVKVFPYIKIAGSVVSSSLLRSLIAAGRLEAARRMLRRPVSVLGDVVRGSGRGQTLGYPTANIDPHHEVVPPAGIYAVTVMLEDKKYRGLCYIGTKPTFFDREKSRSPGGKNKIIPARAIEVYLLNFNGNIYGSTLEVQFIGKIRDDKKFSSPEALIKQIKKDIIKAKTLFLRLKKPLSVPA